MSSGILTAAIQMFAGDAGEREATVIEIRAFTVFFVDGAEDPAVAMKSANCVCLSFGSIPKRVRGMPDRTSCRGRKLHRGCSSRPERLFGVGYFAAWDTSDRIVSSSHHM